MSKKKSAGDALMMWLVIITISMALMGFYAIFVIALIIFGGLYLLFRKDKDEDEENEYYHYSRPLCGNRTGSDLVPRKSEPEKIAQPFDHDYEYDCAVFTGRDYERFCVSVLKSLGYREIQTTAISGDFGSDIVATDKEGIKWSIQCKYYNQGKVGVKAVQEVVASLAHYGADGAWIMTSSRLTENAQQLAKENGVVVFEEFGKDLDILTATEALDSKRYND